MPKRTSTEAAERETRLDKPASARSKATSKKPIPCPSRYSEKYWKTLSRSEQIDKLRRLRAHGYGDTPDPGRLEG